jgi:hypothetical protein
MTLGFISVLIHEVIVGMWCTVSATSIIDQFFFLWDHKLTPICYTNCETIFDHLSDYEKTLPFLPQYSATSHTENNSMLGIENTIDDRTLSRVLWPRHLPDLNLCDLYLWDMLKNKCIVIVLILNMIQKEGIQNLVSSVSLWNLHVQWKTCVLSVMYT